ncbi:SDR family NAD(P)-dependent oxidoreductase [Iamia sp. SCSIO 61187]|uniref:SDR family NAD(P)-dependent oxidoreductase n=1 Tax=Iamia sp. SCSIO 61187 TaxID=2722752 RepID=UPI001C6373CE|nr:SDR family NAD(P)-dependent oxidoreductase [Iamia sp. SCSIO 61187]QYG94418.1 SDR family NAD(P)-dependent oxidoreductase [Iamia sp. SCSIO 61187]
MTLPDVAGCTAVVTGAASGIGFALAERFAGDGARVVMADVEAPALEQAADRLRERGAQVHPVITDVSDGEAVDALAAEAVDVFGPVHLLCNNAGVGAGGLTWELTTKDWEWVLGVNLWGVIHGLRAFLPGMLAHGEPAHVVNTASLAGHVSAPFMAPYGASKFAVVAISEALFHELAMTGSCVGVSVLCPGWVNTNIHSSERNRPGGGQADAPSGESAGMAVDMLRRVLSSGMDPAEVAALVVDAVREGAFYVFTHPDMMPAVETRAGAILQGHDPQLSMNL